VNGEIMMRGPDEKGIVEVHIPPWILRFSWPEKEKSPMLVSSWRTDKDRSYQEDDITPPPWLVKRATDLARIRFSTFGPRKSSFGGDAGEQLRLPF